MKRNFDYDPRKAATNFRKHRVGFAEAMTVFDDTLSSVLPDDQHSEDEVRWIIVGRSARQRILFVVYTELGSTIRLIGARRADSRERRQYEEGT
jgi:uncharacterized DUF497 family protein